jgi:hypothetical protein
MKKLLFTLFFLIPLLISAQTKNDIFNPNVPLVFFGADFSRVQFTKAELFNNKPEILRFFVDCNNLLKSNGYQNIIRKRLKREEIKTDITCVTKNNAAVDWQKVYSDNTDYRLSDTDIENMIKTLNIDQQAYKNHVGMVMCEENYSKTKVLGTVAVVFFSVNDLTPIVIKHYSVKPSGFGFLNYWGIINLQAINLLKKLAKELKSK